MHNNVRISWVQSQLILVYIPFTCMTVKTCVSIDFQFTEGFQIIGKSGQAKNIYWKENVMVQKTIIIGPTNNIK